MRRSELRSQKLSISLTPKTDERYSKENEKVFEKRMKTGLVLEGGAMRGLFTAGILDVLLEQEVAFDGLVGVSAGACFGCNYKSQQVGRVLRYNLRYAHDPRYCSLWSLLTTGGIYGPRFAYYTLPQRLDPFDIEAFDRSPMEFHLVCTDVLTGEAVYRRFDRFCEELYDWILASSSMPIVSKVVTIGNRVLIDGGIADSIPLRYFQQQGFDRNVVILTQPADYQKTELGHRWFIRHNLRRYPALIEAWERRHVMYNEELQYIAQQQAEGKALVLCPESTLPIGRISHSRRRMRETYELGRTLATAQLPRIREFLEKK